MLVVVGLHYCRSSRHGGAARARPEARGRLRGDVSPALSGVLLALTNLANPMFLPSLIFVMSLLQVRGWVGHAVGDHLMYALGFGGGAALWYVLLLRTVTHLRAQFSPTVLPMLARVAGGVLLLCAGLLTYKQIPRSSRRNPLPVKRINGALLMGHEHVSRALVELMQMRKTPSGADRVLHDAPEAFDRIEVMPTMGW